MPLPMRIAHESIHARVTTQKIHSQICIFAAGVVGGIRTNPMDSASLSVLHPPKANKETYYYYLKPYQ